MFKKVVFQENLQASDAQRKTIVLYFVEKNSEVFLNTYSFCICTCPIDIWYYLLVLGGAWQMITQSIIGLSDTLKMYPPPSGAVDPLPSPSESPHQAKKSTHESPIHSPQGNPPFH